MIIGIKRGRNRGSNRGRIRVILVAATPTTVFRSRLADGLVSAGQYPSNCSARPAALVVSAGQVALVTSAEPVKIPSQVAEV